MINKPIYEPKAKAKEYGDLAVNIYRGCNHGCIYCYAPKILRINREDFTNVTVREDIVESVRRQIEREKISGKLIHLCFTCDPYPADIDTTPTREIIKIIKNSGNHVQILTKGGNRAVRDFDLLDSEDWFGVTITKWELENHEHEPNAAHTAQRIMTLEHAEERGIKTWVSLEPVIDPETVYAVITANRHFDMLRIGKLNYQTSDINWAEFGKKCVELCERYGRNYYIKEDLRKEMEKKP